MVGGEPTESKELGFFQIFSCRENGFSGSLGVSEMFLSIQVRFLGRAPRFGSVFFGSGLNFSVRETSGVGGGAVS